MIIEFVVNIGVLQLDGTTKTLSFALGDFKSSQEKTAYQSLSETVLNSASESDILWVMVGFVSIKDNGYVPLLTMQGNTAWFKKVSYFQKVLGDVGGSTATPVSCGFIDFSRNLRVELENGVVQLRSAE